MFWFHPSCLPAAVHHWGSCIMTPQIRLTWRLSINLGFTMQPLCPINTETKAYLPCSHQTIHSTFMSIIIFTTPHFRKKIVSVQSTNLNIQFVHTGTWVPLSLSSQRTKCFSSCLWPASLLSPDLQSSSFGPVFISLCFSFLSLCGLLFVCSFLIQFDLVKNIFVVHSPPWFR